MPLYTNKIFEDQGSQHTYMYINTMYTSDTESNHSMPPKSNIAINQENDGAGVMSRWPGGK